MKRVYEKIKPSSDVLSQIQDAAKEIFPDDSKMKDWYENYAMNHANRYAFDLQYLKNDFPKTTGVKILELGATPPILTYSLQECGYEVVGLDISPKRFSKCIKKHNLFIIEHTLGDKSLPFDNDCFQVIIMNEIFEHLNTNLIELMTDIKRVLKPGGKLYISTPNLKSMIGIRNFLCRGKAYSCCGEIYEEYNKIDQYGHMGHVREYTPVEVSTFLKRIGFKVDTLVYRGKYPLKYRWVDVLFPKMKPFFSLIVSKD